MRPLNAVFTYNRPALLDNCVRSFLAFGPPGDLWIVDDGSSLPQQGETLARLAAQGGERVRVIRRDRDDSQRLGGLYANMERVARQALDEGYDLLSCIQDDMQFMWRHPAFWEEAAAIFAHHPETLVVRPVYEKLIFRHDEENRLEPCPGCPGLRFRKNWFAAVGIVRPAQLAALNWRFHPTEAANNQAAREQGLALWLMRAPVLAFVPSPPTWRHGQGGGEERPPPREYFLKPLDPAQIARLTSGDALPYLEDYCLPWGWRAWSPYDFSDNRAKYLANLWRWFKKNRFTRWPAWRGTP